jgi:hypothetical protein
MDQQIYESRAKDYSNPFKKATFHNETEMEQMLRKPDDNAFIRLFQKESEDFTKMIERVVERL